ncbi:hypothetical protein DOU54_13160 [Agrobacterium sp. MS2]|nr:hypothetical protein DOU54_13160 [Agrobacterium sp. MS2]
MVLHAAGFAGGTKDRKMTSLKIAVLALTLGLTTGLPAMAHVSLETGTAKIGANYKAVLVSAQK